MRVLSLFSGGGLGDYGLELTGMEIIGQVEIDDYCQKILSLRWPDVPKWRDIKEFNGEEFVKQHGQPDIISGGFPCQDISSTGGGKGIEGERSGLWTEMLRIVREVRPRYVLVENVSALLFRGLGVVLGDLAEIGYDAEWDCFSAAGLGAPHRRDRVWIVAYPGQKRSRRNEAVFTHLPNMGKYIGINDSSNWNGIQIIGKGAEAIGNSYPEPKILRVDDGAPDWVDRLEMCGNGQVVQVVQWIGERIMEDL